MKMIMLVPYDSAQMTSILLTSTGRDYKAKAHFSDPLFNENKYFESS